MEPMQAKLKKKINNKNKYSKRKEIYELCIWE